MSRTARLLSGMAWPSVWRLAVRTCSLQVATDEGAGAGERAAPGLEARIPQMPGMDHVRPNLQRHRHLGRSGRGCQAGGIVEQGLGRSDLDEERRQAAQVG